MSMEKLDMLTWCFGEGEVVVIGQPGTNSILKCAGVNCFRFRISVKPIQLCSSKSRNKYSNIQ